MASVKSYSYTTEVVDGENNLYYSISADQHIETKKEIKSNAYSSQLNKIKKATFNFVYKEYLEAYENYIKENTNIEETNLISFYDFIEYFNSGDIAKKVDPTYYFDSGLTDISSFSTNRNLFYVNFNSNLHKNFNIFKSKFPFYCEIIFDSIDSKDIGINKLLNSYKIKQKILDEYRYLNTELVLSNSFFMDNSISTDVDFYTKLHAIKQKNKYSEEDIKNSKESQYEVIAYKISKFYGSTGYSTPIQEWIVDSDNLDILQVIDTQIKFNQNYYYKLSTIVAVAGCVYSSNNNDITAISSEIFITELESTDYEGKLVAAPPCPPDVVFLQLNDSKNKVKMFFNAPIDKIIEQPVPIFYPEDNFMYQGLINSDFYDEKGNIHFETVTKNKSYQVFRLEKQPTTISDFSNGKFVMMMEGLSSFIDDIEVNKKYYYIFRNVDKHDMISNPTKIFTVEMVENSGVTNLVFGIHQMSKVDNLKQTTKSFRKFFSFTPQINHMFSSAQNDEISNTENENSILDKIKVGNVTPSIWGKKFKFRVTSKSTGKKIDFNVAFNTIIDKQNKK